MLFPNPAVYKLETGTGFEFEVSCGSNRDIAWIAGALFGPAFRVSCVERNVPDFDPYYKWLGIPPEDQPPHHYRLLGLNAFESDPDVIDGAASRLMAYLKQCASGPHGALSQQLLNEVAAVRLCLLNSRTKAVYDTELREQLRSKRAEVVATARAAQVALWQGVVSTFRKFWHFDSRRRIAILCVVPIAIVSLTLLWFKFSSKPPNSSSGMPGTTGSTPRVARPATPSPEPTKPEIAKPGPELKTPEIAKRPKFRRHPFDGMEAGEEKALIPQIAFHWCPAGTFTMHNFEARKAPSPVEVTLTTGFWLGETEVTQGQWQLVMETQPWKGEKHVMEGVDYPATYITHDDAVSFCEKLTNQERTSGRLPQDWKYSLPTEAQWEYACRAGTSTKFHFGDDESGLREYAWYSWNTSSNGEEYAHQVRLKTANPWGLFDVHGNVHEWCSDWFEKTLKGGEDPQGPSSGLYRVFRGGGWLSYAAACRSGDRYSLSPGDRSDFLGFRLAAIPANTVPAGN